MAVGGGIHLGHNRGGGGGGGNFGIVGVYLVVVSNVEAYASAPLHRFNSIPINVQR